MKLDAPNGKKYPVVPVRFVQGCVNGHLADIFVACDCGSSRSMAQATRQGEDTLGFCRGERPWLGRVPREKCGGDENFDMLARRMEERAELRVRLFLNVSRKYGEDCSDAELLKMYADSFREDQWPSGARLPEVYFDPRALSTEPGPRAALHAKCLGCGSFGTAESGVGSGA